MNAFYLHHAPPLAAVMHCDVHVVKMALETTQILSTVHHLHGNSSAAPYKKTHEHHPTVVWAAESMAQYDWLQQLGLYLCREYALRYGSFTKRHACEKHILGSLASPPPALLTAPWRWREPPQAMPEECRVPNDAVSAYRKYYREHKAHFAKWRLGGVPQFMMQGAVC